MTKRKAFNFYRSYFEVAQQVPKKYQAAFLLAILNYQFEGKEPSSTKGFELAWISQKHSLDKQLEGYKHGKKGGRPPKGDLPPPPKEDDNQGEGQEEVQYVDTFLRRDTMWRNDFLKHFTINLEEYLKRLSAFELAYDMERPEKDLKQHFFNWFGKQDYKKHEIVIPHWNENRDK